jgi:hypothetical protein
VAVPVDHLDDIAETPESPGMSSPRWPPPRTCSPSAGAPSSGRKWPENEISQTFPQGTWDTGDLSYARPLRLDSPTRTWGGEPG